MAIIYRTSASAWGAGKGSNLTATEVDNNFYELDDRITTLEVTPPTPAEIDTITLNGSQLTITLSDATVFGPYTLPKARFNWRGEWAATTVYYENDVVSVAGDGIYLVEEDHTSAASFDPAADLASGGGSTYALMLAIPGYFLGSGDSGFEFSGNFNRPYDGGIYTTTGTSVSPTLDQAGGYFRCENASNVTFSLPADASINFPIGTRFRVRDMTTGSGTDVTISVPSGVDLDGPVGASFISNGYGSLVEIVKVAANKWEAWGDMT